MLKMQLPVCSLVLVRKKTRHLNFPYVSTKNLFSFLADSGSGYQFEKPELLL